MIESAFGSLYLLYELFLLHYCLLKCIDFLPDVLLIAPLYWQPGHILFGDLLPDQIL